jgi:transposase
MRSFEQRYGFDVQLCRGDEAHDFVHLERTHELVLLPFFFVKRTFLLALVPQEHHADVHAAPQDELGVVRIGWRRKVVELEVNYRPRVLRRIKL